MLEFIILIIVIVFGLLFAQRTKTNTTKRLKYYKENVSFKAQPSGILKSKTDDPTPKKLKKHIKFNEYGVKRYVDMGAPTGEAEYQNFIFDIKKPKVLTPAAA